MAKVRVRGVYGTPWSKLANGIPISKDVLEQLGKCLVESLVYEAKKDFAKRGWSGKDPMGGPPIWDSFSYQIRGKSTVEVLSTFYGLAEMTSGNIPGRKMEWLSQQRKDQFPSKYRLTDGERRHKKKRGGQVSKGTRLPLVVPVKTKGGTVIFRTAPLKTSDAWVHPGIAKFTFLERGIRKGRLNCAKILGQAVVKALAEGDPFS